MRVHKKAELKLVKHGLSSSRTFTTGTKGNTHVLHRPLVCFEKEMSGFRFISYKLLYA
uniref:Uncharacterized protein n=1 Tax=Anguilla anguilla TaxID=7936 RepID=A0A0E9PFC1_ANGAN